MEKSFRGPLSASEILALCRSVRGTPSYVGVRQMLHDLANGTRFRRRVEKLRLNQSRLLYAAAQENSRLLMGVKPPAEE